MKVLVTGSSGLIGSEAVMFFDKLGCEVVGVDNNMRAGLFGPKGDTTWNRDRLLSTCQRFSHQGIDIRDRASVFELFRGSGYELIVHAAAQPSHDLAASRPLDDFDVNAVGTINLLEACRRECPEAVFVLMSTNKVYGDAPNRIKMQELKTRWDYADPAYAGGIAENFTVDQCLHSLFGVSKLAADLATQEYGKYFGLKTGIFRGGCLTGPSHSGVELHGFLNYLARIAQAGGEYTIFGYGGKQVRDQIHSEDVISAIWEFAQRPRPGEVYNIGGGKGNSASIIEAADLIAKAGGGRPRFSYSEKSRIGDHICYYSDMTKFREHFPNWQLMHPLDAIIEELVDTLKVK